MTQTEQLVVQITAEISALRQQMQQVNRVLQNSAQQVRQAGQQAGQSFMNGFNDAMKALAGAITLKSIINFGKDVVETTAEMKALKEQYIQVVGDMKGETDKYLGEMSKTWNKHPRELENAFTQYYALLKGKGVDEKEAYALTQKYLERTVDANAFANESMEDTIRRFTAMIKGEYSSVDTAMVNLSQTMLNDKAQEVYKKKWQDLSVAQQETLKTQIALQQHTASGVLGQGEREANNFANNMAMLNNKWKDFKELIGTPLLEVVNKSLGTAVEILSRWIKGLQEGDPIIVAFTAVVGVLTAILAGYAIATGISAIATGALAGALAVLTSPVTLVIAGVVALIAVIVTLWKKNEGFRNFVTKAWNKIKKDFVDAWEQIKTAWNVAGKFFDDIGTAIKDAFNNAVNFVKGIFDDLWESVQKVVGKIKDIWGTITGKKTVSMEITGGGDTQRHAKGGIFTGYSRLGNHIFGEAGHEAVIPLSHKGLRPFAEALNRYTNMGGNIYIQNMNVRNDGDIKRIAYELKRLQDADNRNKGYGYGY